MDPCQLNTNFFKLKVILVNDVMLSHFIVIVSIKIILQKMSSLHDNTQKFMESNTHHKFSEFKLITQIYIQNILACIL